ncbi:MAG: hypothetical protein HKO58_04570 [Gammaproteobacteria bacterium]|nr:hypothetical protein [Gammaproteobacteria bacterium]
MLASLAFIRSYCKNVTFNHQLVILNTSPTYQVLRFGHEQEPIVVVDNFSTNPEELVTIASRSAFNKNNSYYPGIRASAPANYLAQNNSLLEDIIRNIFHIESGVRLLDCNYSLVTTLPDRLTDFQCFPHFDGLEKGRLAVLHYLCGGESGGTAFYRHKNTGFETMDQSRHKEYTSARYREFEQSGPPTKAYATGSTDHFEQIGRIDAKFNRLIIYRGQTLHSGHISENFTFSNDPEIGRLTINTFFMDKAEY